MCFSIAYVMLSLNSKLDINLGKWTVFFFLTAKTLQSKVGQSPYKQRKYSKVSFSSFYICWDILWDYKDIERLQIKTNKIIYKVEDTTAVSKDKK